MVFTGYYCLFIISIIIIITIYIWINKSYENFIQASASASSLSSTSKIDLYTTFKSNYDNISNNLREIDYNNFINNYKTMTYPFNYICDPMDYDSTLQYIQGIENIKSTSNGYFIVLMQNSSPYSNLDCTCDLIDKRIGYFDRPDLYFIQSLMSAYRQDPLNYTLQKMSINNFNIAEVDYIITYVSLNSSFHKWIMNQSLSIYAFKNIDIDRIKVFYPFISSVSGSVQNILLENIYSPKANIKAINALLPIVKMNIIRFNNPKTFLINKLGSVPQHFNTENFVSLKKSFVSQFVFENEGIDQNYKCEGINGNVYKTKPLCESKYGFYDLKKENEINVWDKPCKFDYQCPFYKSNLNYYNERGGCSKNIGTCEFPIGIKRLGYTKYDDKDDNAPFCYGCSNNDINCCKNQNKPDYAFKNDQAARKKAGLAYYNKINIVS